MLQLKSTLLFCLVLYYASSATIPSTHVEKENINEQIIAARAHLEAAIAQLPQAEENLPLMDENTTDITNSNLFVIQQAQDIIYSGLDSLQQQIEESANDQDTIPKETAWTKLKSTFEDFFKDQIQGPLTNQSSSALVLNTVAAFHNITNNFTLYFHNNDTERLKENSRQNFLTQLFTGGAQQVATDVGNLDNQGSTTKRPNFISNLVSQFTGGKKNETDTSTSIAPETSTSGGFLQNAINKVVGNFRSSTTPAPETSPTTTAPGALQNFGSQIGNIFRQTTTGQTIQSTTPTPGVPFIRNTEMFMCVNMGKVLGRQK